MIPYKINNKIEAFDLGSSKLFGAVSQQMNAFFENRVLSDFAKNEICEETILAMKEQLDDSTPMYLWRGEFWGKWALGACRVYRYTKDAALLAHLKESTKRLISYQRQNGYLNSYKNEDNIFAPDYEEIIKFTNGWRCDWNWNVWCRKYTLWGLIEVYEVTGDNEFLVSATRLADHLIDQLKRLGVKLHDVGTTAMFGLPPMSIIKPLVILYRLTGDKKYLDFCIDEAKMLEAESCELPGLITIGIKKIPIFEWFENAQKPEGIVDKKAKIYEMLSLLDGLLELYRVTGNEKYFEATKGCYEMIKQYEYTSIFSIGFNDQFYDAKNCINAITEPCDVLHWMRLASELYKLTGDIEYIDDFERSFYNPFLAGSFADGKWSARGVRSLGRHLACNQSKMKYSHCCTNNIPRGYINAVETFVMSSKDTLYVNLYSEYEGHHSINGNCVDIKISGEYFTTGHVTVKLNAQNAVKVGLRMPKWSSSTRIFINGSMQEFDGGQYAFFEAACGENVFELEFDMRPEIIEFDGDFVDYPSDDHRVKRYIDSPTDGEIQVTEPITREDMLSERACTLVYGPLLLARSLKCGNSKQEMFECFESVCGKKYKVTLKPIKPCNTMTHFIASFDNGKQRFETNVCDFATGSNEMSLDEKHLFSIWF